MRLLTSAFLFQSVQRAVASYNPMPYTSSMPFPVSPGNYNISDVTSPWLDFTPLKGNCGTNGWQNTNECRWAIDMMDRELTHFFETSDRDLYEIYRRLFVNPNDLGTNDYTAAIDADLTTLDYVNTTLFGGPGTPGTLLDLQSMGDGTAQVASVAAGQMGSFRNATSLQQVAFKGFAEDLLNQMAAFNALHKQSMGYLVGNRSLVQNQALFDLQSSIVGTSADIGEQADDNQADYISEYNDLSARYVDFQNFSQSAIASSAANVAFIKSTLSNATRTAPVYEKDFKAAQIQLVNDAVASSTDLSATSMASLASTIATGASQIINDTADAISTNRNGYLSDAAQWQSDLASALQPLQATTSGSDATLAASSVAQVVTQTDPLLLQIQTQLSSELAPLYFDVINTLSQAQGLAASVAAIKAKMDADAATDRAQATTDSQALGQTIGGANDAVRASFSADMTGVSNSMVASISAKLADAQAKLATIMGSVSGVQSSSATQQAAQGVTTNVQSDVSMTAADLTAAQQQLAGDQAQTSLGTMVSVVSGALGDLNSNLSAIQQAQLAAIVAAQGSLSDAQRQQLEDMYNQVQASQSAANSRNFALTQGSYSAQTDGIQMNSDVALAGQQLGGSVQAQTTQAQALLGQINDILASTGLAGGTITDQMTALESQAPQMVAQLEQKIAQYRALAVAQGQSAQGAAVSAVSGQATDALTQTSAGVSDFINSQTGVGSDMVSSASGLGAAASGLVSDLNSLNSGLGAQSANGAALLQAKANAAMSQSITQMQSSGSDSGNALATLLSFNQDQINQKRSSITTDSDSAIDAATDAANYLTTAATAFRKVSDKFVNDAENFGSQSVMQMNQLLAHVNHTLVAATRASDHYVATLGNLSVANLPGNISAEATVVNSEINAQIAQIQNVILTMNGLGSDPLANLKNSSANLQSYVDSLLAAFQQQRAAFNTFAQQYAIRRIASITGLSQSVIASKAAFLSSLASSDMSEGARASATTDTLQALLRSVQNAQNGGNTDMNQVAALIGGTTSSLGALTASMTATMNTDMSSAQQTAVNNAISAGQTAGNSVDGLAGTAGLIGNSFANALSTIGSSQVAMQTAAAGHNKDVYAIAGLLNDTDQSMRLKVAALLQQVSSGQMSMNDAIASVQNVSAANANTVEDVLNDVAGFVAQHVSETNAFVSDMDADKSATLARVNVLVNEHENMQGDMLQDTASLQDALHTMRTQLIDNGDIQAEEDARKANIDALSNKLNLLLYGAGNVTSGTTNNSTVTTNSTNSSASLMQIRRLRRDASLVDSIATLQAGVNSAQAAATQAQGLLDVQVTNDLTTASGVIQHILDLTKTALQR